MNLRPGRPTKTRREVWEIQRMFPCLPELRFIGTAQFIRAEDGGLHPHTHAAMEICYIEKGIVQWWAGKQAFDVPGGSVYITWPHERHGGLFNVIQPSKIHWLGLSLKPADRDRFLGLPAREARELYKGIHNLPRRSFPAPQEISAAFTGILDCLRSSRTGLNEAKARAFLIQLLATVIESGHQSRPARYSLMVGEAMKLMRANLERRMSLEEIAKKLGWGISHFKTRFRKEIGIPPAEFYLRERVNRSRDLLAGTRRSVTAISYDLGFSSSQYFATVFKRITGVTPQAFRDRRSGDAETRGNGER